MSSEPRVLSGRYRVDDLIGRGGMATVYAGYDLTLGRDVAIKILKRDLARDPAFRTRFRLEAQAASRMSNPAIVRVYDAGEDEVVDPDGTEHPEPYIVMELVHGALLKDVIADGPVPVADAVRYTDGILEALEYSHRAGVVHRDIKPGNVMITETGQVKVMDFGIARAVSDSSSTVADTTAILGTAAYFSPEQAKGETVDARADLYSTGVVLFELLTGRQPFRGESPVAVAYQHVSETPATPSALVDDIPRALDAVVLRALAKDPYQRFQSAAQFRQALDQSVDAKAPSKRQLGALTSELYGPNPRQAAETARSLRQLSTDSTMARTQSGPPIAWIWAAVAVLAAILIALFIWLMSIQPNEPAPSNTAEIPDVVGMSWESAEAAITDVELTPRQNTEASADVEEGYVIRTMPASGATLALGSTVEVWVSTGAELATVPVVAGLTEAEATEALTGAGLSVGPVTTRSVPGLPAGTVIEANPGTGDEVALGSRVSLVVASGRVAVRNFAGFTLASAEAEITGPTLQLQVALEPQECEPFYDPPTVASQSTVGDVAVDATITLYYCVAPEGEAPPAEEE